MTSMIISYDGATYTLTTDHSASSYGEPVLVAADGTPMAAHEMLPSGIKAREIANLGEHAPADGETFRAPAEWDQTYMTLTAYGHATADMFRRFMAA